MRCWLCIVRTVHLLMEPVRLQAAFCSRPCIPICSDRLMTELWLVTSPSFFLSEFHTLWMSCSLFSGCCARAHYWGMDVHNMLMIGPTQHPGACFIHAITYCTKKPTILWDSNTLHDEQTQSQQLESNLVRPFIQNFRIETRDAAGCKPRNSALK